MLSPAALVWMMRATFVASLACDEASVGAVDPGLEHLPVRIVLRRPVLAAAVKHVAAGSARQRMAQQLAGAGAAGHDHRLARPRSSGGSAPRSSRSRPPEAAAAAAWRCRRGRSRSARGLRASRGRAAGPGPCRTRSREPGSPEAPPAVVQAVPQEGVPASQPPSRLTSQRDFRRILALRSGYDYRFPGPQRADFARWGLRRTRAS